MGKLANRLPSSTKEDEAVMLASAGVLASVWVLMEGHSLKEAWGDRFVALVIFIATFLVFFFSVNFEDGDSRYSLLVSQSLVARHTFRLDGYGLPVPPLTKSGQSYADGEVYQLEASRGHIYYTFPPGSSILDVPFLVVGRWFGASVVREDGSYSQAGEEDLQRWIAPLLMAGLTVIFYATGRLMLSTWWSGGLSLAAAFGTQIWSIASRSVWSQTWTLLLLGVLIYLLVAQETGRRKLRAVELGTLLSWMYFVRPTSSVVIVGVTLYVLIFHRSHIVPLVLTGAAWLAAFVVYSWSNFGTLLPTYFAANRLDGRTFFTALAGNLFSPSRGFFIMVPVALFVLYLIAAHWRSLPHRRLAWLALGVCTAHWLAISGAHPWHAGYCYGPRYMTDVVPWFFLLATLGIQARLENAEGAVARQSLSWRLTWAAGAVLLLASIWIHCRGATSPAASEWCKYPVSVDKDSSRVWDWSYPQWLAGVARPPLPENAPELGAQRVDFGAGKGLPFAEEGWSIGSDPDFWWSNGSRASLVFTVQGHSARILRVSLRPYLHPTEVSEQRITVLLNGTRLATLRADQPIVGEYAFPVPADLLRKVNRLEFDLPDCASPRSVGENGDVRELGIALYWMELDDASAAGPSGP